MRTGVGCPWDLACVYLGERFGKWPWELEDQPARKVLKMLAVLAAEGDAKKMVAGLAPDEPFINMDRTDWEAKMKRWDHGG